MYMQFSDGEIYNQFMLLNLDGIPAQMHKLFVADQQ